MQWQRVWSDSHTCAGIETTANNTWNGRDKCNAPSTRTSACNTEVEETK